MIGCLKELFKVPLLTVFGPPSQHMFVNYTHSLSITFIYFECTNYIKKPLSMYKSHGFYLGCIHAIPLMQQLPLYHDPVWEDWSELNMITYWLFSNHSVIQIDKFTPME